MNNCNNLINTHALEEFNEIIQHDAIIYKKITVNKKKKVKMTYPIWNQVCTCIIRIRETSEYLNQLNIERKNVCGQAFSFYEFINLNSIIFECVNTLFHIFDGRKNALFDAYGKTKYFKKSNKTKQNDIKFFKFVRSASAVHPNNTTEYNEITNLKHEFYPYAIWNTSLDLFALKKDDPKDFDISLDSWNSKPNCYRRHYFLYLSEFYEFTNRIILLIKELMPIVNSLVVNYKEKHNYKTLKKESFFDNKSEYCLYLRDKLKNKKREKDDFQDGGLLIASHILQNEILDKKFKTEILKRVRIVAKQMLTDLDEISFDDCYKDFYLGQEPIKSNQSSYSYIVSKFYRLEQKANEEIENNKYEDFRTSFRDEENNMNYTDAEWSVRLLKSLKDFYVEGDWIIANSFTDLFEITLQRVWYIIKENSGGQNHVETN